MRMRAVMVLVLVVAAAAVAAGVYYYRSPGSSGSSDCTDPDNDGDYHIRLSLDSQYSNLTNSANDQYQYGTLVVEVICAGTVTQADAMAPCQGYTNKIPIPNINQHITVTGPYVLDTDHYGWAEIHPVYSLSVS